MKFIIIGIIFVYFIVLSYIYLTQDEKIFNKNAIELLPTFKVANMEHISLHVGDNAILDGVYKHSKKQNAPLLIYFGGNADDATRILLHVEGLVDFDIVSFNYRGYLKSTGKPSEKYLFSDALSIYDKYSKDRKTIIIGRSLGTGVATYLASKREIKGLVLITPYNSIASIAQRKYPIFPINLLLRHKFNSVKYMLHVKAPVSIIEVDNDQVIPHYHLLKLKKVIPNLSLHVILKDTTHADVLTHNKFEKNLQSILGEF